MEFLILYLFKWDSAIVDVFLIFSFYIAKNLVFRLSHLEGVSDLGVINFTLCSYNHRLYNV